MAVVVITTTAFAFSFAAFHGGAGMRIPTYMWISAYTGVCELKADTGVGYEQITGLPAWL